MCSRIGFAVVVLSIIPVLMFIPACVPEGSRQQIDSQHPVGDDELALLNRDVREDALLFGFDLRAAPEEDARQYIPFLEYLHRSTGYEFDLRFTPKQGNIVEDLGTGVVQFAAIGAVSYIHAREKYGVVPLVRGLNVVGAAEYRSMIVVGNQSPIRDIEAVRGKRFAFGDINSTQGHLIPMIMLAEHGMKVNDLAMYEYTGSHYECAGAVISGRFDACGMQDTMAMKLERDGLVRIIAASKFYPSSGIVSNRDVLPEIRANVRRALLEFRPLGRDADGLYHWERTEMPMGFKESHDEDYEELRTWMRRLGFLSP